MRPQQRCPCPPPTRPSTSPSAPPPPARPPPLPGRSRPPGRAPSVLSPVPPPSTPPTPQSRGHNCPHPHPIPPSIAHPLRPRVSPPPIPPPQAFEPTATTRFYPPPPPPDTQPLSVPTHNARLPYPLTDRAVSLLPRRQQLRSRHLSVRVTRRSNVPHTPAPLPRLSARPKASPSYLRSPAEPSPRSPRPSPAHPTPCQPLTPTTSRPTPTPPARPTPCHAFFHSNAANPIPAPAPRYTTLPTPPHQPPSPHAPPPHAPPLLVPPSSSLDYSCAYRVSAPLGSTLSAAGPQLRPQTRRSAPPLTSSGGQPAGALGPTQVAWRPSRPTLPPSANPDCPLPVTAPPSPTHRHIPPVEPLRHAKAATQPQPGLPLNAKHSPEPWRSPPPSPPAPEPTTLTSQSHLRHPPPHPAVNREKSKPVAFTRTA
ncbi:unnamed protein product [Dicrocoelium dendriticum]|nr:unnamed protein product [Dicrocoelium dendriticum]